MGQQQDNPAAASLPPESLPPPAPNDEPPSENIDDSVPPPSETPPLEPPRPRFDPSRMIGIIRRKALMKELAAVYHAEALAYSQELLEHQKKYEEPYIDIKTRDEPRKEATRTSKQPKKHARHQFSM